jgi:hypothetical protein
MYSRIRDPGSGDFSPPGSGIRIWDEKIRDPDPGSGIKHSGSATLVAMRPQKPLPRFQLDRGMGFCGFNEFLLSHTKLSYVAGFVNSNGAEKTSTEHHIVCESST